MVKECKGSPCDYTGGPYPVSRVRYYAYAYDKSGNKASTDLKDMTVSLYKYHQYYSFKSYNYPTHYIRHRNSLGEITKISSTLDKKDATFKIVPGLADSTGISFESLNYPGRYLRHQNYRIKLHPKENSLLFKKDATFHVRSGLADSRSVSFESYNYPGHFLRHSSYHLYIAKGNTDLFRKDATFTILDPWIK